jgi:hypothetical protein
MKYIKSAAEIRAEHEAKVEGIVERNIDWLDYKLMHNQITQEWYDKQVQELNAWAESAMAHA